jgi:hypothetical protein
MKREFTTDFRPHFVDDLWSPTAQRAAEHMDAFVSAKRKVMDAAAGGRRRVRG